MDCATVAAMRYPFMPYNAEIAAEICDRIADGESLSDIVKDHGIPSLSVIYRWLDESKEFDVAYERARAFQADTLDDQAMTEARTPRLHTVVKSDHQGNLKTSIADNVTRSQLIIDTIKWRAAHLRPRRYGVGATKATDASDDKAITIHGGLPDTPQEPTKS